MSIIDNKMSLSCSSTTMSGEKHNMKQFILAAQDYSKTKAEDTSSLLNRYLQLLGVTLDLNTFDPHSSVVAEFFVSLHELMGSLESRSNLVWCGVSVLQQACKNPAAHKALIHTYQFLPILSRLLGDHLTREKKIKLLTLMQELTYGISISWQVSHLPHLIGTLTRWVESGEEPTVGLSLGVLLNLCYRNLPVIYTLMRTVNTKNFLRTVVAMKTPLIEVQVCKLLIILEHINGEVPNEDVLNFIRVTFKTIVEAFKSKDLIRLRHIVEFFLDVRGQGNRMDAVALYNNYFSDVSRVLDAVEHMMMHETDSNKDSTDLECMSLLFEFLQSLVELKISELEPLHSRLINIAIGWVQTEMVCSKALSLLKTVAFCPSKDSSIILEPLASGLPIFLHILQNEEAQTMTYSEHCKKMGALLQLLRALVCCKDVREVVLTTLNQDPIMNVLRLMLRNDEVLKSKETFSNDGIELCVQALALICELATHDVSWQELYTQFINQKQIHMMLAKAFFTDSTEMKKLIFEISRAKSFPRHDIAQVMCELQPSFDAARPGFSNNSNQHVSLEAVGLPIMSVTQTEQLDQAIEKFKEAVANNQVHSLATSEVMELYEYKMSSMVHAERAAQASLEAASQLGTHLQHRVAQMSAEVARLHQLLFHTQQCNEEAQRQLRAGGESVQKLTAKLTKEEIKNKDLSSQLNEKEKELEKLSNTVNILESKQQELIQTRKALTKKYESQCEKNMTLVTGAEKLENCVKLLNKEIQEKTEALGKCNFSIEQMTMEIKELDELRKQHEILLSTKERELQEALQNLSEHKKILNTITKLTTSRV